MAQETGTLLEWLKSEGDGVEKGEPIMLIETDKTTVEIEANGDGYLANIEAQPGDEVPVGTRIALIVAEGEEVPSYDPSEKVDTPPQQQVVGDTSLVTPLAHSHEASQSTESQVILASPKAKRLAIESSLPLASIVGTGPNGAIIADDVLSALGGNEHLVSSPKNPSTSRVWQVMAKRLTESWQTVPHFYLTYEANVSALNDWYSSVKHQADPKITITDLLVKLTSHALALHPQVNAKWENGAIVYNKSVHVGLAVAVDVGLQVPVVHNTDRLTLRELAVCRSQKVERARNGSLSTEDVSNGTFTISNLGMYGASEFCAIVNPPQAAILAVGAAEEKVVSLNGKFVSQRRMRMTLSCDHRVIDGATGALFMKSLVSLIETPMQIIE
jgi:pyruvate dehydrogenase E2 component (dihydrolipoamide acetyltransferase)